MEYTNIRSSIWEKLKAEGSRRKNIASRGDFDRVCEAFIQAEECPMSDEPVTAIKHYRANYNIWAYYFGEDVEFPGKDPTLASEDNAPPTDQRVPVPVSQTSLDDNLAPYPSPDTQVSQLSPPASIDLNNTTSTPAIEMRQYLEGSWLSRDLWKGYSPQLGFNPSTGEPWMSVRTYASNGYPALSGSHHRYLHTFEKQIPEFDIRYERFGKEYVLIWPEFKDLQDILKDAVWEKFHRLRAFLANWASETGRVDCVFRAHRTWSALPEEEQKGLDAPEGFVLEECRGYLAAVAGDVLEKFPKPDREKRRVLGNRRDHQEEERDHREERDSYRDRAHRIETETRRSLEERDDRTERRQSPAMIDRYRPKPRGGLDERYRPRRSRSRSRSRGRGGGVDRYRPAVCSRSQAARDTDRYGPRY